MKKQVVKTREIVELFTNLQQLGQLSKIPMKFTVARNAKLLQPIVEKFNDDKDALFKAHVLLNESGELILKDTFKGADLSNGAPFEAFQFSSDEAEVLFNEKLEELMSTEVEVDFYTESPQRKVMISTEVEGKVVYTESTIEEVLEDPNNDISTGVVALLLEYMMD